jgi:hypothetical protein
MWRSSGNQTTDFKDFTEDKNGSVNTPERDVFLARPNAHTPHLDLLCFKERLSALATLPI